MDSTTKIKMYWSVILLLFCIVNSTIATENKNSKPKIDKRKSLNYKVKTSRKFSAIDDFNFDSYEEVAVAYYEDKYFADPTSEELKIRESISATFDKVVSENRFIDFLSPGALIDLPVGISKDIGVLTYTILIDSVVITPTESFLFTSMKFETPQGKSLYFTGRDIQFSNTGGLTGDGKLALVGDHPINLVGDKTQLVIKGSDQKTFVEFDCNGFKQFSLDASLLFSRDLLVPEDENGNRVEDENVAVNFTTTVVSWEDILVEANVPKFQVKSLEDVSFEIKEAVFDFSDTRNPGSITFPQGYSEISPLLSQGTETLWRGIYIRELSVELPPQFVKEIDKDGAETGKNKNVGRVGFTGYNFILDNAGFSGKIEASNLIPIEKGKIGNWNFSLEAIYVNLVANELTDAGFNGKINVPINSNKENNQSTTTNNQQNNKEGSQFTYTASIKPGNEYLFNVSNADTLNFDLWKAKVTLNPTSYIEIKLVNKQFRPKAHLDGMMSISMPLKKPESNENTSGDDSKQLKAANITFQDLEIQAIKPYVKLGSFSLGSPKKKPKMGGFSLEIKNISGTTVGEELRLGMDIRLGLTKKGGGSFGADGRVVIVSKSQEVDGDLKYKFRKLEIERFGIDIDKGVFSFKGQLNFYKEDPVYGNGISGNVKAKFKPGLEIEASAIFGTKDDKRYWYVDALARFNSGITLFPGIAAYSFGGGAYYHMALDTKKVGSELGQTASGVTYVPDLNTGFGFKAVMGFGVQPGKSSFNAEITYEMAFNTGGGVKYINLSGNGKFMSPPGFENIEKLQGKIDKMAATVNKYGTGSDLNKIPGAQKEIHGDFLNGGDGSEGSISAQVNINYNFEERTLHGTFDAYVNVAGGLLKGVGPNGKAGNITMHFAPGEWYIYVGRPEPENRFGLTVLGIATFDAYFVMGSVIPDFPPPPPEVAEILGVNQEDLNFMSDLNALEDGAGIGFGASFRVDTGDITFLVFYARLRAGLGFDVMLKNYGDAECKGRGGLGINGWYASAQAYGYFEGSIGIKFKLFFKRVKIPILEVGAAILAQAKLPNPVWIRGIVGGRFSVLGGLVKGNCKFEVTIGEECELIQKGSVLESIDVLAEITPQENSKDVSVFVVPQAVFNFEMDKEYSTVGYNDEIVKFKIQMDKFVAKVNGKVLNADIQWNDEHNVAALKPFDVLPPLTEISLSVTTSFVEFKNGNWVVATSEGEQLKLTNTIKITSGIAPDHIPPENIAYAYPVIRQVNYYKNETNNGYITLKQGQPYLFEPSNEWDQVLRISSVTNTISQSRITYNNQSREVRYNIPNGKLQNNKIHKIGIVNVPKGSLGDIDANVDSVNTKVNLVGSGNELNIKTQDAVGSLKEVKEKFLHESFFRTSQYNSFNEKVASTNLSIPGFRDPLSPGIHRIGSNFGGNEPYAQEEITNINNNEPLIQIVADLNNVSWYQNEVYPLVYQGYPINSDLTISPSNRDVNFLGVVPTKAVVFYQVPFRITLTDEEISNQAVSFPSTVGRVDYYLPYYMYNDYLDLHVKAADYVFRTGITSNNRINKLITSQFPVIKRGDYWVNIKYKLPGKNIYTSTYRHKIVNPINR